MEPTRDTKGRINISYELKGEKKTIEDLPFRFAVVGDFILRRDDNTSIRDREFIAINQANFNTVMENYRLELTIEVPAMPEIVQTIKHARDVSALGEIDKVTLHFKEINDFTPDRVAEQLRAHAGSNVIATNLDRAFRLREALTALKGPMGNKEKFRKALQELVLKRQEELIAHLRPPA